MAKITWDKLYDFSNDADVQRAIKTIENLGKVQAKVLKDVKTQKTAYKTSMDEVAKATDKTAESMKKLNPALVADAEAIIKNANTAKELSNAYNTLNKKTQELTTTEQKLLGEFQKTNAKVKETLKLEKESVTLKARLKTATSEEAAEVEKLRLRLAETNKAKKQAAKEALGLVSLYQKESKQLIELRKRYKDVALQYGVNSKQAQKLRVSVEQLDNRLKRVDAGAGQFQRSVGNYGKAMQGAAAGARQLATALGFTGVIFALVGVIKNAINQFVDFEKSVADLAGVMNKTRKEVKPLADEALRLGSITAKTASQVLEGEEALARLGFTQSEILASIEAVINGSITLNAELEDTAQLTGAVIRAWDDLDAVDAESILDKISVATQKSSNTFDTLATSLPKVAGAANAMGISLDEVLRDLSIVQDATQDASISGTSLRKVYLELAKSGQSFDDALLEINTSSNKVGKALDLFGVRAAVAALALANNRDRAKELDEALENAGGTIERVAELKLETLRGRLTLLKSAWEGLILSIENGEGVISDSIKSITSTFTNFLTLLQDANIAQVIVLLQNPLQTFLSLLEDEEEITKGINAATKAKQKLKEEEHINDLAIAQEMFNKALERGVSSYAEFESQSSIKDMIDRGKNLHLLTMVQDLYNKKIKEESDAQMDALAAEIERREGQEKLAKKQEAFINKESNAVRESAKLRVQTQIEANERVLENDKSTIDERIDAAKKIHSLRSELITAEANHHISEVGEYTAQGVFLQEQADKAIVDSEREKFEAISKLRKDSIDESRELMVTQLNTVGSVADGIIAELERIEEETKNAIFNSLDIMHGIASSINDVFANFKEARNQQDLELIEEINEKRELDLEAAGENADAREAINARADREAEKIEKRIAKRKQKQARADKALALAAIAINTAEWVTRAGKQAGIFGLTLAPFIIALGAAQAAVVLSTPIPQFAEGTDYAPEGAKIVGERGRELVTTPKGESFLTGNKAEVRHDIPEGSQILTNAITERILRGSGAVIERNEQSAASISNQPLTEATALKLIKASSKQSEALLNGLGREMDKRPVHVSKITERGISRFVKRRGSIIESLNSENSTGGEG